LGPRWNDGPNDRFFSGLEFIKQCWVWKNHLMGYWKGTFPNTMDRHGPSIKPLKRGGWGDLVSVAIPKDAVSPGHAGPCR
jgi:hypothetical protein